ncbi:hypothetical protein IFM89_038899 [Coptis chinensis]|uniref:AMP-binding enzyme C-terminal domain-containing protein n=1 Tax=Coptis chinensis TaxID=261450 RepID=A0A835MBQ3_9MAGN|nr:hypothetical protein IFM89_038899 [Coptis chinensis]
MRNPVQEIESAIVRVTQSLRRSKGEPIEVEEKTESSATEKYPLINISDNMLSPEQVPPAELEHLLQSHPEIADVALIPYVFDKFNFAILLFLAYVKMYPDEEAGQIPMAFVVRKPGSNLSAAQVMEFVAKQACLLKTKRFILNAYRGFLLSVYSVLKSLNTMHHHMINYFAS